MEATSLINSSAAGTSHSTTDRVGSNKLGKDEFVKLLLAQLGNQDPTAPTDSQAFVAQLAQFASLEQMQNVNDKLGSLTAAQQSSAGIGAATLVGKDAEYHTDGIVLGADGKVSSAVARVGADAANVTAVVSDSTGAVVRKVELGPHAAGDVEFSWDGKNNSGTRAPAGDYKVRITAGDKAGGSIAVEMHGRGTVSGVSFSQDGLAELVINGSKVKMSDVQQISLPSQTQQRSTP